MSGEDTIEKINSSEKKLVSAMPDSRESLPPPKRVKIEKGEDFNGAAVEQKNYTRSIGTRIEYKPSSSVITTDSKADKPPPPKTTYCHHDVSVPSIFPGDYDIHSLEYPENPAKEYLFDLDAFQRQSVKCVERNESVLVAAHTSAGKTAVAEYAIALALKNKQRVIYTSPIKALSNQKYRELQAEFSDVGLMTGDNTIDKNASCLVMTTEILRSMLYRGSEVVREVAWVIFDEVHYMRDKDRGVVWEEAIILVPQNVRFVFLSATIPNAREFSEWIAHLKGIPCHTIYTDTRPVPLKHYVYSAGAGSGIHLIVDQKGQFLANNFDKAMTEISSAPAGKPGGGGGALAKKKKGPSNLAGKADCYKVIEMIHSKGLHPVIVFSFSRRDCEAYAMQLAKLDFNTPEERDFVQKIFENAITSLNEEDRGLPQITAILPLLLRGIGIHHSGLLPIIKEVVELMFNEGLIKCLFATETFAMGVNMPARTVLFCQLRKFDGERYRYLNGGEYIQMSGRAGRRGVDDEGIAILMCDEKIEPTVAKSLMSGVSEPLNSTFHLGYNMLLNLMRAEEADPEYVIGRSFAQFQGDRMVPKLEGSVKQLEAGRDAICLGRPDLGILDLEVRSYFKLKEVSEGIKKEIRDLVHKPGPVSQFLQPGRLLRVEIEGKNFHYDYGWGAVVDLKKRSAKLVGGERYSVEIALRCVSGSNRNGGQPIPFRPYLIGKTTSKDMRGRRRNDEPREEWMVVSCSMRDLQGLSAIRVVKPNDLRSFENRAVFGRSVAEVLRRFPDGPPMLDPITDMGISDENLVVLLKKAEAVEEAMIACPASKADRIQSLASQWEKRKTADARVKDEKKRLKAAKGLILQEELKKMRRVLRRLDFTNADGIVEVKGRVACEVNTADELVITELLLGGNMNDMPAEILVALCSCFVNDEGKRDEDVKLEKDLQAAYDSLSAVAMRVATVKKEAGLNISTSVEDVNEMFRPHAMRVVYYWMKGRSFSDVCKLSDLFEGSVIRVFRRLEELLRQLVTAVKAIGNSELAEKFETGSATLKRGIAFHSSLYI